MFRCRWSILKGLLSSNGAAQALMRLHLRLLGAGVKKIGPAFAGPRLSLNSPVCSCVWTRSFGLFAVLPLSA